MPADSTKFIEEDGKMYSVVISYYICGTIMHERWYYENNLHRESGPAMRSYDNDGNLDEERWFKDGKMHREGAPAIIAFDYDVLFSEKYVVRESYYKEGKVHRTDGHAIIYYNEDGTQRYNSKFFIEGNWVMTEDLEKAGYFDTTCPEARQFILLMCCN